MRFLHTADWHLGKLFHGIHLTEDQAFVLDQVVEIARDQQVEAVLISGDIYDRAVPIPEAIALFGEVLDRLVRQLGVTVLVIAGNHDSPDRLGCYASLLAENLYIFGTLPFEPGIRLRDEHGPVHVYPLPYAEPAMVRDRLGAPVQDHNSAAWSLMDELRSRHPQGERAIVMAHTYVAGGEASESERPISVGGASMVDAGCFEGFHYTALGHLHRPQTVGSERIRYSGSILKYSFSEASDRKAVQVVDMDARGDCRVESIEVRPRREVRRLSGRFEELLKAESAPAAEDYLEITLLDSGPLIDPMARLRERYPYLMNLRRADASSSGTELSTPPVPENRDELALFKEFYETVTEKALKPEQCTLFSTVVDRIRIADREVRA